MPFFSHFPLCLDQQSIEFTANQGRIMLSGVGPIDTCLEVRIISYVVVNVEPWLFTNQYNILMADQIGSGYWEAWGKMYCPNMFRYSCIERGTTL
ncbi:hypothetical protein BKA56DRAFT_597806 [Ilyonectria sp. MPI-CAGE-AT-0026]|nr:hypothetical protein BKA56DRAFT_597806 [Ilyonectria sp. MPI-CAGE-AT-0026]